MCAFYLPINYTSIKVTKGLCSPLKVIAVLEYSLPSKNLKKYDVKFRKK